MTKLTILRAGLALLIFVVGSVQAWDSDVPAAGFFIILLVSLAIALPAVALLVPLKQAHFVGAFVLSLALLVVARFASPTPMPGLFLVILPAGAVFVFTGLFLSQKAQEQDTSRARGGR